MSEQRKVETCSFEMARDGLHIPLGGKGFPKGSLILIKGPVGSGKSALCQRLSYGFLEHGYRITYVSSELTTKAFVDQMDSMDYPIMPYLLNRDLVFLPVFPLIGNTKPRYDFLGRLLSARQIYDTDIMIIDAFSSLIQLDIDPERAIKVLGFLKKLAGQNRTFILTADPAELSTNVMGMFESVADIFLDLDTEIIEGSITHKILIKRFSRAAGHVGDAIGFRIEPRAGLIVDITTVA